MKKALLFLLITLLCFSIFACDTTPTESSGGNDNSPSSSQPVDSSDTSSEDSVIEVSLPDSSVEDLSVWFEEFTNEYFKDSVLEKEYGASKKDVVFNELHGYALQYPSFDNESSDTEIESVIASIKSDFDAFASSLEDPTVLFLDYSSTTNDGYGSVIFTVEYVSKSNEVLKRYILTRSFEKNGTPVLVDTLFRSSYREIVRDEILSIFSDDSAIADRFSEHDMNLITNESSLLSEFVLFDSSVEFLFLNSDGTIAALNIPKTDIRTAFINVNSIPRKLDPSKKMIAITYDDGPDGRYTNKILDVLERYGAVATFFELGEMIKGREEVILREVELGCEVGSHSWEHLNMLNHSLECLQKDKDRVDKVFKEVLGYTPTLFRPPYGNVNDAICEMYDMVVVGWTLDTLDWQKVSEGGRKDTQALFDYFVQKHEAGKLDGQVALMHSIYSTTAEATELIVPYLLDNGYQLVTVSELITYKLGKEVTPGVRYYSGYTVRNNKDCDCD